MLQMMFLFDIQAFLASLSSFHECTDDKQERLAELQVFLYFACRYTSLTLTRWRVNCHRVHTFYQRMI